MLSCYLYYQKLLKASLQRKIRGIQAYISFTFPQQHGRSVRELSMCNYQHFKTITSCADDEKLLCITTLNLQ